MEEAIRLLWEFERALPLTSRSQLAVLNDVKRLANEAQAANAAAWTALAVDVISEVARWGRYHRTDPKPDA